jgi:hypothetical protein
MSQRALRRSMQRGTQRTLAKVSSIQEVIEADVRAALKTDVLPYVAALRVAVDGRDFGRVEQLVTSLENIFAPLLTDSGKPA